MRRFIKIDKNGWRASLGGNETMVILTRLNGIRFVLNSDLIETIEETPDTTIKLLNKHFVIVKESMQDVVDQVIQFRRAAWSGVGRSAYLQEVDLG